MKKLGFIFLVLPFFITSVIFFAIIIASVIEYGKIDFADFVLFIGAMLLIFSGMIVNLLKNKLGEIIENLLKNYIKK